MSDILYNIIEPDNGPKFLTAVVYNEIFTINSDHPNFTAATEELEAGDQADEDVVYRLMTTPVSQTIASAMRELSSRVSYDGGSNIYFDDQPVMHTAIVERITDSLIRGDDDWRPLVNFFEHVADNPSMTARRELFDWIEKAGLSLSPDGCIIGYKGLNSDGESINTGSAFVDNTFVTGHIPNKLNSEISMGRQDVDDDRENPCSQGLHVGTYEYAVGYAKGVVATVLVYPEDVVSIPRKDARKMRTCGYTVIRLEQDTATYLGRNATVDPDDLN